MVDSTGPAPAAANKGSKSIPMPASAIKKSSVAIAAPSRSRSTSVMPGGSAVPEGDSKMIVVEPEKDPEAEEDNIEDKEDDKLYCVCKTRYDENRVMIACDRYVMTMNVMQILLLMLNSIQMRRMVSYPVCKYAGPRSRSRRSIYLSTVH